MNLQSVLVFFSILTIASGQDRLKWFDSYEAARKEAKTTGKPILLEFRCAP